MSPPLPAEYACYEPLMRRACELALRGEGSVEPNPMVGCVIAHESEGGWRVVGEGWHQRFGGPHAEVNAIASAGASTVGATLFVTLEPCSHTGKTPPCVDAVIASGVGRVVIAREDPFPRVAGRGIDALRNAGIECVVGPGRVEAERVLAPYLTLTERGRPWVIAKWAMTLDGKIATRTGDSRWISGEASRAAVHELRARVDAVIVGPGTLVADDPELTARLPEGREPSRVARRVVVAGDRPLPIDRKLWLGGESVTVALGSTYPDDEAAKLAQLGVETMRLGVDDLLQELGRRRMTNVLVEGGAKLLGELLDARLLDEVIVFVAPKIAGGAAAPGPVAGRGVERIGEALRLTDARWELVGEDSCLRGRVER